MIKLNDIILWILTLIPLAVNIAAYSSLPDTLNMVYDVPVSKEEIFRPPLAIVICMMISYGIILFRRKKQKSDNENVNKLKSRENVGFMTAYFMAIALDILDIGILFKALGNDSIDIIKITCMIMGAVIAVIGNFQPKMHESKDPIKTKWNTADSTVWLKANRFTGFTMILCGILIIAETLIFDSITAFILMLILILAAAIIAAAYSQKAYKEHRSRKK